MVNLLETGTGPDTVTRGVYLERTLQDDAIFTGVRIAAFDVRPRVHRAVDEVADALLDLLRRDRARLQPPKVILCEAMHGLIPFP